MDEITLRMAMETDAWMMVWAAEPERNIKVQMSYADLIAIRQWIDDSCDHKKDKDGTTYVEKRE